MLKKIQIKEILKYLTSKGFKYTFSGNEDDVINGFSTLFNYKSETITFISTLYKFKDHQHLFGTKKIRLILKDPSEGLFDNFQNVIQIEKPTNAFFSILEHFYNNNTDEMNLPISNNNNYYKKHSYISEKAKIGKNVKIGYGCVIEAGVSIGDNTEIHHNVVIRNGTKIHKNCTIFSGTIIGERGFNPYTLSDGRKEMLDHFGGVLIENDVHIGANCSIHRGSIDDTTLKKGVKLNTMVHIAHNCIIGENTVITAPTQISGSVKIGKQCHIAATTIRNQCTVGDNVVLGLGSVVVKDVEDGMTMVGNPARPLVK